MLRLSGAAGTAVVLVILSACGRRAETAGGPAPLPPATVRVAKVEAKPRLATEEVMGSVRARLQATLEAKISGRIEEMLVVPGQTVKTGELLARLDAREAQARLDQAMALREAAQMELKRVTGLLQQQVASQQEFDAIQARARVTVAAVAEAETLLGHAKVLAPFDGVVSRKFADVGDLASPGKLLLELEDPSALRLEADVPEALIDRLTLGHRYSIRIAARTNMLEGTSAEINPVAEPSSRTFLVKFDLPAVPGLRAGQFGRVWIPVGEMMSLRIPTEALVQRGQMELVFVNRDETAQLRLVKAGKRLGQEVEIISGLDPGEQVVCEGAATLREGQRLKFR